MKLDLYPVMRAGNVTPSRTSACSGMRCNAARLSPRALTAAVKASSPRAAERSPRSGPPPRAAAAAAASAASRSRRACAALSASVLSYLVRAAASTRCSFACVRGAAIVSTIKTAFNGRQG